MKVLILFVSIFFLGTNAYAQQSTVNFIKFNINETEKIESYPDFDFEAEELKSLSISDLLSIFVEENLKVENIKGKGKMTTLLSLEISQNGVLNKVSAIGGNETFNNEAVSIFKKYEGKLMQIEKLKNIDTEVLIPITVIL